MTEAMDEWTTGALPKYKDHALIDVSKDELTFDDDDKAALEAAQKELQVRPRLDRSGLRCCERSPRAHSCALGLRAQPTLTPLRAARAGLYPGGAWRAGE